jgi:GPI mannosyltransferase 3
MHHLRNEIPKNGSVGFLMPCYSTPWQVYLQRPDVEAWKLTCEPPLG